MTGISELKNSQFLIIVILLLMGIGCKDSPKESVSIKDIEYKTNIRFATKTDGYKEKSSYARLKTDKTEVTSTKFQMEGPAWENENVAFRNYFDARNGMDIFGKRKDIMVLDAVGIDENYHELQPWGMDILKVGNSLGAGAIALIIKDSIYRVGVGAQGSFKTIEESPTSSTLEFYFKDWKVQDRNYNVTHTINIKSGTHHYEAIVKIEGLKGDELLAAGIVDHSVETKVIPSDKNTVLSTYGNQDVENKPLGMAISMDNKSFTKVDEAKNYKGNVDKTHLMLSNKNGMKYRFYAGWAMQDEAFKTKEYFEKMILAEIEK